MVSGTCNMRRRSRRCQRDSAAAIEGAGGPNAGCRVDRGFSPSPGLVVVVTVASSAMSCGWLVTSRTLAVSSLLMARTRTSAAKGAAQQLGQVVWRLDGQALA